LSGKIGRVKLLLCPFVFASGHFEIGAERRLRPAILLDEARFDLKLLTATGF
jgi:hypothetical protein